MKDTREKRDLQGDLESLLDFKADLVKGIDHLYFMLKNSVQRVLCIEDKESFKIAEKDTKRLIVNWIRTIRPLFELQESSESDCSGEDESDFWRLEISKLDYYKKRLSMLQLELRQSLQIVKKYIGAIFKKTAKNFKYFFKEESLTLIESRMAVVKVLLSYCRNKFVIIEETLLKSNLYQELSFASPCTTFSYSASKWNFNGIVKVEPDARTASLPTGLDSPQTHTLQKTETQTPISGSEGFLRDVPLYRIWKVVVHEVESPSEMYLKICDNKSKTVERDVQDYNTEKIIQIMRSQELLKCSLFGLSPPSNGTEWKEHQKDYFKDLFMDSSSVFDVRFLLELQDIEDGPVPILMAIENDNVLLQKYLQDSTFAMCCKGLINEVDHMNPSVLSDHLEKMETHFAVNFHSTPKSSANITDKAVCATTYGFINSQNDINLNCSSEVELNLTTNFFPTVKGKVHPVNIATKDKCASSYPGALTLPRPPTPETPVHPTAKDVRTVGKYNDMKLHCSSSELEPDLILNFPLPLKGKEYPINTATGETSTSLNNMNLERSFTEIRLDLTAKFPPTLKGNKHLVNPANRDGSVSLDETFINNENCDNQNIITTRCSGTIESDLAAISHLTLEENRDRMPISRDFTEEPQELSFNVNVNECDIFSLENEELTKSILSDYYSSQNNPFMDDEDLDAVMNGYKRDMSEFCKFGLKCTHRICDKKHIDLTDRILDEERLVKYGMYNPGIFPKESSFVSLVITKIESRNNLVGVILMQEQDSENERDPETLTSLLEAMQRFYRGTHFIDFKGRPCEGELFAAKSAEVDSWFRSRIIDISGDEVEAYDVDTGFEEIIPITNLRTLKNQFAHLPEQAVGIGLSNIQMLDTWSSKEVEWYEETMMENTFWGRVDEIIGETMMLTLWHNTDIKEGEFADGNSINQMLIDTNLAKKK